MTSLSNLLSEAYRESRLVLSVRLAPKDPYLRAQSREGKLGSPSPSGTWGPGLGGIALTRF